MIAESIINFCDKYMTQVKDIQHILALFRIKSVDGVILTLGQLQKLSRDDKDYFINFVENILAIKSDDYKTIEIDEIIISFGLREGKLVAKTMLKDFDKKTNYQFYRHYKLPITMDPLKYGIVIHLDKTNNTYVVQITSLTIAKISVKRIGDKTINEVEIYREGHLFLKYVDTSNPKEGFVRRIGKNTYNYDSKGKLILFELDKPSKFITKTVKKLISSDKLSKFITMDIETRTNQSTGELEPYLIAWFDGSRSQSYFLSEHLTSKDIIQSAVKSLLRSKYNGYKIYIHNLANFDGIFLMKVLIELGDVKPLIHNGKIISIQLQSENKKITLHFRDSYQILLSSLRKLGKAFNVDTVKGDFPHNFLNTGIDLDYQGVTPDYKYFNSDELELEDYNKLTSLSWNLRDEAIKYCIQDCVTLHQIMDKFNLIIFDQFGINVNDAVTLPSLTFKIFRTNYLEANQIASIHGKTYDHITESYTGGKRY